MSDVTGLSDEGRRVLIAEIKADLERRGWLPGTEVEGETVDSADLWSELGAEFDRKALERLEAASPNLARILRDLVRAGADPSEVRSFARRSRALAPWETGAIEAATRAIYADSVRYYRAEG